MVGRIVLVVLGFVIPMSSAMGLTCFEESSELQALGADAYFTVAISTLDLDSQKKHDDFLKGLYGEWNYTTEERLCSTSDGITKNETLEASGTIILSKSKLSGLNAQMVKDYKALRRKKTEKIDFLPVEFITNLVVSKKELKATARYRKFKIFHERILQVDKASGKIRIELIEFIAGTFSSTRTITLEGR